MNHHSVSDSTLLNPMESPDLNDRKEKTKKDKRNLMHMFKRSKKSKERQLDAVAPHLGVSIGTAETKRSFSKLKNQRQVSSASHLTPPLSHRYKVYSGVSDAEADDGSYSDGASSESELIATLVNPTAAALSRSTSQLDSLETPGNNSRVSWLSMYVYVGVATWPPFLYKGVHDL